MWSPGFKGSRLRTYGLGGSWLQAAPAVSREPCTSRVLDRGDLRQRGDETAPVGALLGQDAPPRVRDPVVTPPAGARLLDPASLDPAAVLEAVQGGVQRRERERQPAVRALLDHLRDFVPVMGLAFDDRENDQFGAAFLGIFGRATVRHAGSLYEGDLYITGLDGIAEANGWRGDADFQSDIAARQA